MVEKNLSVSLNTSVGGIELDNCIYNAAGARCTLDTELFNINKSSAGAILTKSSTKYSRMGNAKPKYYEDDYGSINANGLENLGMSFYREFSKNTFNKPYIISVAGLGKDDIPIILEYLNEVQHIKKTLKSKPKSDKSKKAEPVTIEETQTYNSIYSAIV